jgi:competence protein ComEC
MKNQSLLICLSGFVFGVLISSFWDFGIYFGLFLALIAGAVFLVEKIEPAPKGRRLYFLSAFLLFFALGVLRFSATTFFAGDSFLDRHIGQVGEFEVQVSDEPDERRDSVRLTVEIQSATQSGSEQEVSTKALVVTDLYPKFQYGDRLKLKGLLQKPKNFADENGKVFDYQSYLAKEGIYYEISRPKTELLSSENGNFVVSVLLKVKNKFLENIRASIPEPHASLLGGLVVGAKQSLGKDLLEDFRRAGVIHIVVLSGYNITIVAEAIISFFGFLPRYFGQVFGAVGIVLFAIMTGGSATVVRASLMALLVILARATGRKYEITRALMIAGFLMILQNPKILVFDSSFQLSFASTLALIYVSPILEKYFQFITEKFGLRSVVVATLSTQVFVLPMLLYKMGELSIVALPVNLLILSVIPATMFFGFLTGVLGLVSTVIAFPFAFISYALLSYELYVVEFSSKLPFAVIAVPGLNLLFVLFAYFIYLLVIIYFHSKKVKTSV